MNNGLWRSITEFATAVGMRLLWDLNAVDFRTPAGAFDIQANTSALLAYTAAAGLQVANWELGNEPDIYSKHFGINITGTQLVADLRTVQSALAALGLSTAVTGPSLATFAMPLVQDYLVAWEATGGGELAFSAHAYPLGPPTYLAPSPYATPGFTAEHVASCSVGNYLNLTRVSNLVTYLNEFSAVVAAFGNPSTTRLVLEETASNSLGGCIGFSDRFISGFYWMNVLGVVAEASWAQINRQDLAGMSFTTSGSQYTLMGFPGWTNGSGLVTSSSPHADYFTTILWRRLMGRTVLGSVVSSAASANLVAHVWCASPTAPGSGLGAVTVAYINAGNGSATLSLSGAGGMAYATTPRHEFFLTAGSQGYDGLTGYAIHLNGAQERLKANADGSLPASFLSSAGRLVTRSDVLIVPPLSYGFVVLPAAAAPACILQGQPAEAHSAAAHVRRALPWGLAAVVAALLLLYARHRSRPPRDKAEGLSLTSYGAFDHTK